MGEGLEGRFGESIKAEGPSFSLSISESFFTVCTVTSIEVPGFQLANPRGVAFIFMKIDEEFVGNKLVHAAPCESKVLSWELDECKGLLLSL